MTTIACNREVMACDSRVSWDNEYATCDDKVLRIGGELVGTSGNTASIFKFLAWYKTQGERPEFSGEEDRFEAVVLNKTGIYLYINTTYPMRIRESTYATGSGGMAAKAAMLCGKTPAEAVSIAIKCDKNSGPPVRCYSLTEV